MAPRTPPNGPAAETRQNGVSLGSVLQWLSDSVDKGDTRSVLLDCKVLVQESLGAFDGGEELSRLDPMQ